MAIFLLFVVSVASIVFGFVGNRIRTSDGKRLVSLGLIFLAATIQFSVANGVIRSSLLANAIGLVSILSGLVVGGIAWYQARGQ